MSASFSDQEIEDRFFLRGQVEILSVLNDLAHRREPISVYFNNGQSFILSAILSARPDGLVFDLGGDPNMNRQLEKASHCVFMAFPEGIRVQFTGMDPQRFMWGEDAAFWVPIPERIIRLQRREFYRNLPPISQDLRAKLHDVDGNIIADWRLHDISVGGFGIITEGEPQLRIGDTIPQAWITLLNKTNVHCPVTIQHITFIERTKLGKFQVGFQFRNLNHAMDITIQKTILNIEYERHRLIGK